MKCAAGLALLLLNVRWSQSCYGEGPVLFCVNIPQAFRPGYSALVLILEGAGGINSTVLHSDSLSSVARLRIENAGVTGVAEGAFSSFQKLTNLSLKQNLLKEMNPKWLGRPDILSELTLTENLIEVLNESTLNGLVNLTTLRLNRNRIGTIDPNSFSSQTILAELDLSENRMIRVSPQVFGSLRSTRIRLDGNPWDCSCGAEDFVASLKDLRSKSLLDRPLEVTCESPPSLRGRPVWNVSVCATSPPLISTSVTQTGHLKPTGTPTAVHASSANVATAPPSRPTPETEPSVQTKPTDAPSMITSHAATPPAQPASETQTSVRPEPTDTLSTVTTPALKTATYVTSPPSVTEISVHPKPSVFPTTLPTPTAMTETCAAPRPSSDTDVARPLVVVIVVLVLLLPVACFLGVLLHRRNRNSKTVTPRRPNGNRKELKGDSSRSSRAPPPQPSEEKRDFTESNRWASETGWGTSFTGVRAKSANAVLVASPFCAAVRDQVTLQTETAAQPKDAESQAGGKQKRGSAAEVDGGIETENRTNTTDVNVKQAADAGTPAKDPHCVAVDTDTVAYLSIGTNQNKPNTDDFHRQSTDGPGQRSQTAKVMGRISTWPPTAIQWQARCKMEEEEEEERCDVFTVWTPKFPGEVRKGLHKVEHPPGPDRDNQEEEIEKHPTEEARKMNVSLVKLGHAQSSTPNGKSTALSETQAGTVTRPEEQLQEEMIQDPGAARQATSGTRNLDLERRGQKPERTPAAAPAHKDTSERSNRPERRNEPKPAATSRQRAEGRSTGSKALSGGASPDDETLLSGNEWALDLLHEVVQNNGRWTRERWRQMHGSKQRR